MRRLGRSYRPRNQTGFHPRRLSTLSSLEHGRMPIKLSPQQKKWLQSVLAIKPGGTHRDLGQYRAQQCGRSSIQPIPGQEPRRCARCGGYATRKGHDPCLADLPGVINACCGHGWWHPYATLRNGFCLRGRRLKVYLKKVERLQRFHEIAGKGVLR
jgi:hypothetical protein